MKTILNFFVFILFFTFGVHSQSNSKINLKGLDKYFEKMIEDWDVPAASIGIVKDGEIIFTGNYGVLEVGSKEIPDENTLYAIASNSKAFTSAIIGMLVQEGKLNWNDHVKKYLPYFAMYDPWVSDHLTIRDLLSHRVGLGTFSGDNIWYKSELVAEEMIKRIKYVPKAYDFRAGYGYSNLMYITAGELIKTVSGKSWSQNVQERILDPLNMERTISTINDLENQGNFATPHARKNDQNYVIPWTNWDEVAATGGLISSVSDISKWMIFNLNHGIQGKDTLLTSRTRNMVWTPHNNHYVDHTTSNVFDRHFSAYGLGWGLSDYHGHVKIGHTGGYDGMITAVTLIPDENLGVVVLTNGVRSPIMAATYYAIDQILGIDGQDWSTYYLDRVKRNQESDTRILDRKRQRVEGTKPTLNKNEFMGDYRSKLAGKISISEVQGKLKLFFEDAPLLSASLTHWHYDTWEIHWEFPQAWFSFGTIKFNTDNNLKIKDFDFDVPNDDFFFEELKPKRIKTIDK